MQLSYDVILGALWWGAAFVLLGVSAPLGHALFKKLRKDHHQVWVGLGRPTLFLNATWGNQIKVARFVWRGGQEKLEDRRVHRIVRWLQLSSIIGVLLLGAGLLLVIMRFLSFD